MFFVPVFFDFTIFAIHLITSIRSYRRLHRQQYNKHQYCNDRLLQQ